MKTFMLGLAATASAVPRIELDMAGIAGFTSCGSACSTGLHLSGAKQPDGTPVLRRQDYVYTCKADSDACKLPTAKAWDHNEGALSVSKKVYLADLDGAKENPPVLMAGGAIDRTKRSKYIIYYDAVDSGGNHAEQVVLELVLNDEEKPVISPCQGNTKVEAADCAGGNYKMCESTATDNIDDTAAMTSAIRYTISRPDGKFLVTDVPYSVAAAAMTSTAINSAAGVENTVGTFTVALQVQDEAGQYGKGGKNNVQTDTFSITFQDTMKPVLECLGSGCAGTNVPASSGFNSASAHVHECATAYDDAAVGGVDATDCLDDLTSTKLDITSDVSNIKTGAPNSWPKLGKGDTAPYFVKFDVSDRDENPATSAYRKVVVTDTTKPVAALVEPEKTQITHESAEGNELNDPGATCSDTCDKAIAAPATHWSYVSAHAGHSGCTEIDNGSTVVWSCDKRAQVHGKWDGKKVGEYIRTYTCTDASGNVHSTNRKFIVVDNDQPVITIVGDAVERKEATNDEEYEDAGATCSDYTNGQLSDAVVVSSWNNKDPSTKLDVDYSVAGTYTVEYNCQDLQGNDAPTMYRTVIVKDTTCPVVTINGANLMYIEAGFPYVDAGAKAHDSLDGDITKKIWKDGDTVNVDKYRKDGDSPKSCEDYRVNSASALSSGKYFITTKNTRVEVWCDFHSNPKVAYTFYKVQGTKPVAAYTADGAAESDCAKLGMWMWKHTGSKGSALANAFADAKVELGAKWFSSSPSNLYTCTQNKVSSRRLTEAKKVTPTAISSVAGMYVITYHVADFNKNRECANSKNRRTVVVKDTLPPVITLHLGKDVINQDQVNAQSDVGLGGVAGGQANPAAKASASTVDGRVIEANPSLKASPDYVVQANSFPLYNAKHRNYRSTFMAEAASATSNGWVMAGFASAVTGLALLGMSTRRAAVTVEV